MPVAAQAPPVPDINEPIRRSLILYTFFSTGMQAPLHELVFFLPLEKAFGFYRAYYDDCWNETCSNASLRVNKHTSVVRLCVRLTISKYAIQPPSRISQCTTGTDKFTILYSPKLLETLFFLFFFFFPPLIIFRLVARTRRTSFL